MPGETTSVGAYRIPTHDWGYSINPNKKTEIISPYLPMTPEKAKTIEDERTKQENELNAKKFAEYQVVFNKLKNLNLSDNEIHTILYEIGCYTGGYSDNGDFVYDFSKMQGYNSNGRLTSSCYNIDFSRIKINTLLRTVTYENTSPLTCDYEKITNKYNRNGVRTGMVREYKLYDDNFKTVYKFDYNKINEQTKTGNGSTKVITYKNGKYLSQGNYIAILDTH